MQVKYLLEFFKLVFLFQAMSVQLNKVNEIKSIYIPSVTNLSFPIHNVFFRFTFTYISQDFYEATFHHVEIFLVILSQRAIKCTNFE